MTINSSHYTGRGAGAHVTDARQGIQTGMLILFWGFEIWPNSVFLCWQILSYFLGGFEKFPLFFWV